MFKRKPKKEKIGLLYKTNNSVNIGNTTRKTPIYGYSIGEPSPHGITLAYLSPVNGQMRFDRFLKNNLSKVESTLDFLVYCENICMILNSSRKEQIES